MRRTQHSSPDEAANTTIHASKQECEEMRNGAEMVWSFVRVARPSGGGSCPVPAASTARDRGRTRRLMHRDDRRLSRRYLSFALGWAATPRFRTLSLARCGSLTGHKLPIGIAAEYSGKRTVDGDSPRLSGPHAARDLRNWHQFRAVSGGAALCLGRYPPASGFRSPRAAQCSRGSADPSANLDCSINSASMHQDSDVDRISHRQVTRAVGMHMIACTADTRIGDELGLHRAGGRIGSDGIEVDYVVEQSA